MSEDDELIREFLVEAREIVMDVEVTLMNLERTRTGEGGVSLEELHAAFRGFHTVKGVAGFFGFDQVVHVAHEAENLLDRLRNGQVVLDGDHITVLCDALDLITVAVDHIEADGQQGLTPQAVAELATALRAFVEPSGETEPPAAPPVAADASPAPAAVAPPAAPPVAADASPAPAAVAPPAAPPVAADASPAPAAVAPPVAAAAPAPAAEAPIGARGTSGAQVSPAEAVAVVALAPQTSPAPAVAPAVSTPQKAAPSPAAKGGASASARGEEGSGRSIRVDLNKLDQLMDMVGELIIAENMVNHGAQTVVAHDLEGQAQQQLVRATRNLQHLAMSMRMVPIRSLFRKMVRVVRDVARRQGKDVRVELLGEDTEVDKTVVESISDPLMHLVRNAVDHGIELPEVRRARGKDPVGIITLSARHESGEVRVTIADDGGGLDLERIRAKALSQGLIQADQVLDDEEVAELLFRPGFSTAEVVTNISGRGVGMDVVRRNVQSVRGRVDVAGTAGKGTQFTMRLPLTLAIIEGMMMRLGRQVFTVPLASIRESVSLEDYERLKLPSGTELVDLRGTMVPLLPMAEMIPYAPADDPNNRPIFVVIEDDGKLAGVLADELIGQRQVVVKPIPELLSDVQGLMGCSILGDGDISLILDVKFLLSNVTMTAPTDPTSTEPIALETA